MTDFLTLFHCYPIFEKITHFLHLFDCYHLSLINKEFHQQLFEFFHQLVLFNEWEKNHFILSLNKNYSPIVFERQQLFHISKIENKGLIFRYFCEEHAEKVDVVLSSILDLRQGVLCCRLTKVQFLSQHNYYGNFVDTTTSMIPSFLTKDENPRHCFANRVDSFLFYVIDFTDLRNIVAKIQSQIKKKQFSIYSLFGIEFNYYPNLINNFSLPRIWTDRSIVVKPIENDISCLLLLIADICETKIVKFNKLNNLRDYEILLCLENNSTFIYTFQLIKFVNNFFIVFQEYFIRFIDKEGKMFSLNNPFCSVESVVFSKKNQCFIIMGKRFMGNLEIFEIRIFKQNQCFQQFRIKNLTENDVFLHFVEKCCFDEAKNQFWFFCDSFKESRKFGQKSVPIKKISINFDTDLIPIYWD